MKNKGKEKKLLLLLGIASLLIITITIVTVNILTKNLATTNNLDVTSENIVKDEPITPEKTNNNAITIIANEESSLNREESNISAFEQSNLERAIDDLITLTEME